MIKRFQRIFDYLALGVGSFATFGIGSIVSFRWGLFAFILILVMWRKVTWRKVMSRKVISYLFLYLSLYLLGVTVVSGALSWLELADGRTDPKSWIGISGIASFASALYLGYLSVHFLRKTKSDENTE